MIGGRLFVLEGGRGHVLEIDPASGAKRVIATLPGFTHGLAEYGGVLFVGLSRLRDKRGSQGLPIEGESAALVAGGAQATRCHATRCDAKKYAGYVRAFRHCL